MGFPNKIPKEEFNTELFRHLLPMHSAVMAWRTAVDLREKVYPGMSDQEIIEQVKQMSANELFQLRMAKKPAAVVARVIAMLEATS